MWEIEPRLQFKWTGQICFVNKLTFAQILEWGLGVSQGGILGKDIPASANDLR